MRNQQKPRVNNWTFTTAQQDLISCRQSKGARSLSLLRAGILGIQIRIRT